MICRRLNNLISKSAEREGFKPPVPVTVHLISNQAHSITLTPLRGYKSKNPAWAGLLLFSGELGFRTLALMCLLSVIYILKSSLLYE